MAGRYGIPQEHAGAAEICLRCIIQYFSGKKTWDDLTKLDQDAVPWVRKHLEDI